MKTQLTILVALLPLASFGSPQKALCKSNEKVVFSCFTGSGKSISVCAGGKALQYRFGRPGKVELEYPKTGNFTASSFQYFHYFRYNLDRNYLSSETADAKYLISSDFEDSQHSADLSVTVKSTGRNVSVGCVGATEENWYRVEGKVECAAEPLNSCH